MKRRALVPLVLSVPVFLATGNSKASSRTAQLRATVTSIREVEDPHSGAVHVEVGLKFGPDQTGIVRGGQLTLDMDPVEASRYAYGDDVELTVRI